MSTRPLYVMQDDRNGLVGRCSMLVESLERCISQRNVVEKDLLKVATKEFISQLVVSTRKTDSARRRGEESS